MKSIKLLSHPLFILTIHLLILSCQSAKSINDSVFAINTTHDQSDTLVPGRAYPIQKDTLSFHEFNDIRLKKNILPMTSGGRGEYISINNVNGYKYYEVYPAILTKLNTISNQVEEIIYYNSSRDKIIYKINISKENPYVGKYKNLILEYPSFEKYNKPPDSLMSFYRDSEPDDYLTYYSGGDVKLNGYSTIEYYLVGIKSGYIKSWETSIVIYNPKGENIGIIKEPNVTDISTVSDNGFLIAYKYGNYLDNPIDDAPNGEVRIRNIQSKELIFQYKPENNYRIDIERYFEIGCFISLGHTKNNGSEQDTIKLDFIDLNNRIRYRKNFSSDEFYDLHRRIPCMSCLVLNIPFDLEKI